MGALEFRDMMIRINAGLGRPRTVSARHQPGRLSDPGQPHPACDSTLPTSRPTGSARSSRPGRTCVTSTSPITWIYGKYDQLDQVGIHPGRHERRGRCPAGGHCRPHRSQRQDIPRSAENCSARSHPSSIASSTARCSSRSCRAAKTSRSCAGPRRTASLPRTQEPEELLAPLPRRRRQPARLRHHGHGR